jgi:hypothetical protein
MIYAGCFIPYSDRWCEADRRRSDGHLVPQALHFSNAEHCRFGRTGPSGCLGRSRLVHHRLHPLHEIGVAQDARRLEEVLHLEHLPMDSGILGRKPREPDA